MNNNADCTVPFIMSMVLLRGVYKTRRMLEAEGIKKTVHGTKRLPMIAIVAAFFLVSTITSPVKVLLAVVHLVMIRMETTILK